MVILSGGQDSTLCLYVAKQLYHEVEAITFDYGQKHSREIEAARQIVRMAGIRYHRVINVTGLLHSVSPLITCKDTEQYQDYDSMIDEVGDRVEKTFVPMRNALFLTIGVNRAIDRRCSALFIGINQSDSANYPDCSSGFLDDFSSMCQTALNKYSIGYQIKLVAPLMTITKAQSIKLAYDIPGCWDALAYTHTSYDGEYPPVSRNHANVLREQAFLEAGLPDPLIVRAWVEGQMDLPETDNYKGI